MRGLARVVSSVLNEALNIDGPAVRELLKTEVVTNLRMAEHPTIMTRKIEEAGTTVYTLRPLSLLNGVLGPDYAVVAMCPKGGNVDETEAFRVMDLRTGKLV